MAKTPPSLKPPVVALELPLPEARLQYSPLTLIQLLLDNPLWTKQQLAAQFGQREGWLSLIVSSQAFQEAILPYKDRISDPYWTATVQERFQALAIQSAHVIQTKLSKDDVADFTALKAAELGIKALGVGQMPPPVEKEVTETGPAAIANKILKAMAAAEAQVKANTVDAEFEVVTKGTE